MTALMEAIAAVLIRVVLDLQKAGEDRAAQEEALMQAAERLAELREKVKFG